MSKVITFSRYFPADHPKKGQPTYFVEKICNGLIMTMKPIFTEETPKSFLESLSKEFFHPKYHTIRSGKRWKTGDMASLRVWSGAPYASKQIAVAPNVAVVVKDIEIKTWDDVMIGGKLLSSVDIEYLAKNDGLSYMDMVLWLGKRVPFSGQLIIFSEREFPY